MKASPRPCDHEADRRDCGTCVAAAHDRACKHLVAVGMAAPATVEAQRAADTALDDALAAKYGHAIVRANGIAATVEAHWPGQSVPLCDRCRVCCSVAGTACRNPSCPGRRVRCEMPEVRS